MYKFEVTKEELQLILTGLLELPAKNSVNLINKIQVMIGQTAQQEKKVDSPSYAAVETEPEE